MVILLNPSPQRYKYINRKEYVLNWPLQLSPYYGDGGVTPYRLS
jgi:hypothetical protein